MALMLALGAGLTFGVADFTGGLAAKRASATAVTFVSQAVGLVVLLPLMGVLPGVPSIDAFVSGGLAGIAGALGVAAYLRALALGPMGVVAPLASVVGVMVPVAVGVVAGERPSVLAAVGIAVGLVAITVVAGGGQPSGEHRGAVQGTGAPVAGQRPVRARLSELVGGQRRGPLLALAGGAAFGVFFVLLDLTPPGSGLWPLVGARIASLALMGAAVAVAGRTLPARDALPMVAASGALDMLANILFLLATRAGLLTISALLASLYPVVVVVLARQLLSERLRRPQVVAVLLALLAVGVITVG